MVDKLEKIFSAPAIALDKTVDTSKSLITIIKERLGIKISEILNL